MADPVLIELASGQTLVAYPVTFSKADGSTVTALSIANILVSEDGSDVMAQMVAQQATMIALLEQLAANAGGAAPAAPAGTFTPSLDFSDARNSQNL